MPILLSTIRPAPGGDGPYFVTTETDGVVDNVTLALASLVAAINQCRDDQGAIISAKTLTVQAIRITTSTTAP